MGLFFLECDSIPILRRQYTSKADIWSVTSYVMHSEQKLYVCLNLFVCVIVIAFL